MTKIEKVSSILSVDGKGNNYFLITQVVHSDF